MRTPSRMTGALALEIRLHRTEEAGSAIGGARTHTRRNDHTTGSATRNSSLNLAAFETIPLRVGVHAANERRRAALTQLVEDAGHRVVAPGESEVLVSDGRQASLTRPTLVIRDEDSPTENRLPWDA